MAFDRRRPVWNGYGAMIPLGAWVRHGRDHLEMHQ